MGLSHAVSAAGAENKLSQAVERLLEWEALGLWAVAGLRVDGAVPDEVIDTLEEYCPGLLADLADHDGEVNGARDFVEALTHWALADLPANGDGWREVVASEYLRNPHRAQLQAFFRQWQEEARSQDGYPGFEEWKERAFGHPVPAQEPAGSGATDHEVWLELTHVAPSAAAVARQPDQAGAPLHADGGLWLEGVQHLLRGMRSHAVRCDIEQYRHFQETLQGLEMSIAGTSRPAAALAAAETAVQALAEYSARTSESMRAQFTEIEQIIEMVMEIVPEILAASQTSCPRRVSFQIAVLVQGIKALNWRLAHDFAGVR